MRYRSPFKPTNCSLSFKRQTRSFLKLDYRVECYEDEWNVYAAYAAIMILVL